MNILVTTSSFPVDDKDFNYPNILNFVKNLNANFKNIKVTVLAPYHSRAKKYEMLDGIEVYRYEYFLCKKFNIAYGGGILHNLKNNKFLIFLVPFFVLSQARAIRKIVHRNNIDIIHANWLIPQGFAAYIYKLFFCKKAVIVCTTRGSDVFALSSVLFDFLRKKIIKKMNKVVCISTALKNELNKYCNQDKTIIIPNGVNLELFHDKLEASDLEKKYNVERPLLLYVGRLAREKGIEYIIRSFLNIKKNNSGARLMIVGDGSERERLEILAKELDLQDSVIFAGSVKNVELGKYYNLADVFVSPSLVPEGFGIVYIEAMASGLPVVASNIGGTLDIITDHYNGRLVSPGNEKEIRDAVVDILSNDKKRKEMINNARKTVNEKYSWNIITKKYFNLYKNVLL